jgi:hypothetical protein
MTPCRVLVADFFCRARLAKHIILKKQQHEVESQRFQQMLKDLKEEQKVWITLDNMDSVIIPELFGATPTSTGLVTKYSDHWRYYVHPFNIKREMAEIRAQGGVDEFGRVLPDESYKFDLGDGSHGVWEERMNDIEQSVSSAKLEVENKLNEMIGSAEERENYRDLVRRYIASSTVVEDARISAMRERLQFLKGQDDRLSSSDIEERSVKSPAPSYIETPVQLLEYDSDDDEIVDFEELDRRIKEVAPDIFPKDDKDVERATESTIKLLDSSFAYNNSSLSSDVKEV